MATKFYIENDNSYLITLWLKSMNCGGIRRYYSLDDKGEIIGGENIENIFINKGYKRISLKELHETIKPLYKGEIEGFPFDIVEKMLYYQKIQTGKNDVSIFEDNIFRDKSSGGFNWDDTEEEYYFWWKVISHKDFNSFYIKYPINGKINKCNINNKEMKIFKTKEVNVKGSENLKRRITICILIDKGSIKAGYSVVAPMDECVKGISEKIAEGRACKKNMLEKENMICGQGMDKKYILYAIADNLFKRIESGTVEIKGVKEKNEI